ncbi:MAG: DNA cytosine methyltransferase, partial [Mycoplasmataceae bacterium]|nr:DNA cytosine methyltransferase [Mycoplasmataceae bacterium]
MINGFSLFSNVGIDELFLKRNGVNMVGANEFLRERCKFYKNIYPKNKMICGDITNKKIFDKLIYIYIYIYI